MRKLALNFYLRDEVDQISRELLGKIIVIASGKDILKGRIVETEAYAGITDAASHAYKNRKTARTSVMYENGGTAYLYHCYGMHLLFNIVTHQKDIPHAVLIRAVEPLFPVQELPKKGRRLPGSGPALVTKLLGMTIEQNGQSVLSKEFYIGDDDYTPDSIDVTPRIGVDYAGEASKWLYRFIIQHHPYVTPHPFNQKAIPIL